MQDLQERFSPLLHCCAVTVGSTLRCLSSWLTGIPFYSLVHTWNIVPIWLWIETFCSSWIHWFSIDVSGGARAQSVTQPDGHITVSEGTPLELRCNYSFFVQPNLFHYVQYPNKDSSFSWSIHLKTALFQTSTVVKLNLTGVRTLSTGGKHQPIGKTQPSTSVLWMTRCLGLQGELNANLVRSVSLKESGSQTVLFLGSWHVLWRPKESWKCLVFKDILDYFCLFVLQKKEYCFLNFSVLHGIDDGRWDFLSMSPEQGLLAELIGCRSRNISSQVMTLPTQGLLGILRWNFPSSKAKCHEEASGLCAEASVCPGLLWVGAPTGESAGLSSCSVVGGRKKQELTGSTDFLTSSLPRALSGFCRSSVAQLVKNRLQCRRCKFDPWVGKILWRRERLPTAVF